MQEHTSKPARSFWSPRIWGEPVRLWPILVGLGIVLFPLDWLAGVWPAYGQIFNVVFVTARDHFFGHATMYFLMSLLGLLSVPALRARPVVYWGLMLLLGVAQETVQTIFKQEGPVIYSVRDILVYDLTGITLAYLVVFAGHWLFFRKKTLA
jgi:predicted Na+-dependent transporter